MASADERVNRVHKILGESSACVSLGSLLAEAVV
jgi:hypothetical protein